MRLAIPALGALTACGPGSVAVVGGTDTGTTATSSPSPSTTTDSGTSPTLPPTTPTPPSDALVFDDQHVLVLPNRDGLSFMASDGTIEATRGWTDLLGVCDGCTGEGASADGDGLLFSWQAAGTDAGIGRIDGTGALEFQLRGLAFPHDAVRDPFDDTILVPEAFADRITWYPGDGASDQPVRLLDTHDEGWMQPLPSGVDKVIGEDGSVTLVVNNRGGFPDGGIVTGWDITDPDHPALLWRFPREGALDTPHGAVIRRFGGRYWLLYAHSYGALNGGSVGVAVTSDPRILPEYLADLVPTAPVGPLEFVRGVELTTDGTLWITDSGPEQLEGALGRVISAPFPDLAPTGASGAVGDDQVFVDLEGGTVVAEDLANPFEGWLWVPTFPL